MRIAELFDVRGLATVVTVGASGIGLACAQAMLANGARSASSTATPRLWSARRQSSAVLSREISSELTDVADEHSLNGAVDRTVARFGGLDVLLLNAGIGGGPGYLKLGGERNAELRAP
jgi:NAD(P)-dependent dehydrogenase (short-subunit alcohol dehydrogenase family)